MTLLPFFRFLLVMLFVFTTFSLTAQSGWTREEKGIYAQVSFSHFYSDQYYNLDGVLFDEGSTFSSSGLLLFGEYGIKNRLTAIFNLPLLTNRFSSTETVTGLGSLQLGLKYRLLRNFPLSIQLDLDIPTDDGINFANAKEPNSIGITERINLPTSDGEFNVWTTLAASKSSASGNTFGSIFTRVNFRTESFSHQFQAGLELGHLFFEKIYLIGKLRIQDQLGDTDNNVNVTFLYGEGTTFTSYNLTAMYQLNSKWSVVASYTDISGILIERRNTYDGPTFSIGLAYQRKN